MIARTLGILSEHAEVLRNIANVAKNTALGAVSQKNSNVETAIRHAANCEAEQRN